MSVQLWTYFFSRCNFCAIYRNSYLVTRWLDQRVLCSGVEEFLLLANGMATAADWMSAASFISMAGLISFMGFDGSVYLMGWTGGYVLLALLLAPYLRKFGKFTVPDFIGERYYSKTARIVAVLMCSFSLFYLCRRADAWSRGCFFSFS